MQNTSSDKMVRGVENKASEPVLIPFNFPAYQITVMATSHEDAEKKLEQILKDKEINNKQ